MGGRPYYEKWKVDLPEGTSGDWCIRYFKVSKQDASFSGLRSFITGSGRSVPEGQYTGLFVKGGIGGDEVVMSDTPDEIRDHISPICEAESRGGHVLINGLGLGMVAAAILDATNEGSSYITNKVTVIEKSEDVIALVRPTLWPRYENRLEIIHADAYEYKPPKGVRYSVVWHDIWTHLCTDNLKGMGTLHRKYGRRCDWQGSWGKERMLAQRRRDKASGWY